MTFSDWLLNHPERLRVAFLDYMSLNKRPFDATRFLECLGAVAEPTIKSEEPIEALVRMFVECDHWIFQEYLEWQEEADREADDAAKDDDFYNSPEFRNGSVR